jgi:phage shock protein E
MNQLTTRSFSKFALLAVATLLIVAACGGGSAMGIGVRKVGATEAVNAIAQRTVIDVRSASEAAEGMIAGATVLDFNSGQFEATIGSYDRSGSYFIYCRSGSRSGQAVEIMKALGFTDVIDAGAYSDLVGAGAPKAP